LAKWHVQVEAQYQVEADSEQEAIDKIKQQVKLGKTKNKPDWYAENVDDGLPPSGFRG
jgi:hypothetical protein